MDELLLTLVDTSDEDLSENTADKGYKYTNNDQIHCPSEKPKTTIMRRV
jgi:hypothetical protein